MYSTLMKPQLRCSNQVYRALQSMYSTLMKPQLRCSNQVYRALQSMYSTLMKPQLRCSNQVYSLFFGELRRALVVHIQYHTTVCLGMGLVYCQTPPALSDSSLYFNHLPPTSSRMAVVNC
ncbi:hypothetical protein BgiBS90_004113 [Biomphalaria glabrata]|nr:hypothetical protein BgiBS90_004113 [Biomphalaria glabrata]